jgi:putative two-component system response regulator
VLVPEAHSSATVAPLVLIVEDDPETRLLYKEIFSGAGFRVAQAHNGYQAFDKAIAERPDVILTDIAVPGLDGIELCRKLRADDRSRRIPILGITGYGDRLYHERALEAGVDRVLTKPSSPDVLVEETRRLLVRVVS